MNLFKRLMAAALLVVPVSYSLHGAAGERLDATARAELIASGQAQRFVTLPMGVMHVRDSGPRDGPVVLLVHGGVVGGFGFEKWRKPLADAGYRVIVPDLFGYGFSDRPDVPYNKGFYTRQLGQLLDALDVHRPVNIVGASLGGAIVTAFTARTPSRVRAVVLVAPAGGGRVPVVNPVLLWPGVGDVFFSLFGPSNLRDLMNKAYAGSPDQPAMAAWMKAQTRFSGYAEGVLNTLRHFDAGWLPEDFQALGRSGLPVLAVWGTADEVNPFAQSEVLRKAVPQMRLVPLEGKGHAITYGESARILETVIPFFEQHP